MTDPTEYTGRAQEFTNGQRAGAGTSSRCQETATNASYHDERHNCIDPAEACGWREVYHAMGVEVPR